LIGHRFSSFFADKAAFVFRKSVLESNIRQHPRCSIWPIAIHECWSSVDAAIKTLLELTASIRGLPQCSTGWPGFPSIPHGHYPRISISIFVC
jgi:hypothetical protein